MYIVIFEDGSIRCAKNLSSQDFESVKDGCLDIVRIDKSGTVPKYYDDNKWIELEVIS